MNGNTNEVSVHYGKVITDGNDEERSRDIAHTIWPHTPQHKGTDETKDIRSSEHASLYTCSALEAFSPNGQENPSGMDVDSVSPHYQVSQHPMRSDMENDAEEFGERTATEGRKGDLASASTSASKTLFQEKDQELESSSSNWTFVIKEATETSNGVELGQDASNRNVYEQPQSETRGMEPTNDDFDPVDCKNPNAHEKCKTEELTSAQDSSVIVLFDGMRTSVKSSQDLRQSEVNSLTDDSSVNNKVQKKTTCKTLEQCSSLGFNNTSEICSLEQHVPTKEKQVSDLKSSCLSDTLSAVRTNMEKQSKNLDKLATTVPSTPSDMTGNREGTLSPSASQLRQISKGHESYEEDCSRMYVDKQTKLYEDCCPKGNNESLPDGSNVPGQNIKLHMTQRPNSESNVSDHFSHTGQHECARLEMTINPATTENLKPGVSHNGLAMEENWSSNMNVKSNTYALDSTSVEISSACSTSAGQLEKLTQNHYTDIPPTPKLKSTHPAQADTTSERANDCEDSGLPTGEDGSLKVASNAECTQTEEALSTLKPTCPAAQSPPKVMEKQTPNSMDTQEPSTFHNSSTEPGDVSSDKVAYMKTTGKECSNTFTKFPRLNYLKRVQQQSTLSLVSENVLQTATLECEVDVLKACFLETSDNGTAKDLQISQNEVSRDLKTEVRSEKTQTSSSHSVQTCSSIGHMLPEPYESLKHQKSILPCSVPSIDTVDSHTCVSNCNVSSSAGQRATRPPQKHRKSTCLRTNTSQPVFIYKTENSDLDSVKVSEHNNSVPPMENNDTPQISCLSASAASTENKIRATASTNLMKRKIRRTSRKRTLLKIAIAKGLENESSGKRISLKMIDGLQALNASKRGKTSNLQLANINLISLRHSRGLSRFTRGKIRGLQKPDYTAASTSHSNISSKCHSALSYKVHHKSTVRKKRKHSKKKSAQNEHNTTDPLLKSSSESADVCCPTSAFEGKIQKTSEDGFLTVSNGEVIQVASQIPPRARNLNSEKIECVVVDPNLLEDTSETLSSYGELQVDNHENSDITGNPEQESKRKALTGVANEEPTLRDAEICSPKVFCAESNNMLVNAAVKEVPFALSTSSSSKSKNKDVKVGCKKMTVTPSTETDGEAPFELSLQSSGNTTGFHSSVMGDETCDKKIKEEKSEKLGMDTTIRVSDLNILARDVTVEDSGLKAGSESMSLRNSRGRIVSGFTQCFEDFIAALNKSTWVAGDAVKRKKVGSLPKELDKKVIVCKYCGQYFRHISAYTVHQRIHTGEKPYRCKVCGKNFAQLSKLKSHRKIHTQREPLRCPCCPKTFSRKTSLVSHFKTHLQETEQNHGPDRDIKYGSSARSTVPLKNLISDQSLLCKICDKAFPNKFKLKIHMHVHDGKSHLSCGKKFPKSSQLQVHEKTHWPVKPYVCSICGKGFSLFKAFKKHAQVHTGATPLTCSYCGHAFHDLSALQVHQVSMLCSVNGKINGGNGDHEGFLVSQGTDGQVNTPVFFKCQICKKLCRTWCQYTLHLETHTKTPPYLCFSCGQSYVKGSDVCIHCKVCCHYSGEEVTCRASLSEIFPNDTQKCPSSASASAPNPCSSQNSKTKNNSMSNGSCSQKDPRTPTNLLQKEHLNLRPTEVMEASSLPETEIPVSPVPSPTPSSCVSVNDSLECIEISPKLSKFQCSRCGQQFKQHRTLRAHMLTHVHGFGYACGSCGQSFERWNRLWLHQRIHHKKRRCYSCLQCNLQFRFFGSYKEHMLDHARERPFACPICHETFAREEALHAHQCEFHRSSKILQCDVCAKTFSNLRNLLKHSRLHNGAVSYRCLSCKLFFTNNKILQQHLTTHHTSPGLPVPDFPSESLAFLHKCKRCKASFSTGDLLYAHQICHFGDQACRTHINKSTSSVVEGRPLPHTQSESPTTKLLIPSLNLEAVPKKCLYIYPHPDKLYVVPSLSRTRLPVINLDSEDEKLQPARGDHAPANTSMSGSEHSGERMPVSTPFCSETTTTQLPQASESPECTPIESLLTECMSAPCTITSDVEDNSNYCENQTDSFVDIGIFLEEQNSPANTGKNKEPEVFLECADCSYRAGSLLGLHEHYFLHAFGN